MTSADSCRTRGILSHRRERNGEGHHPPCGRPSENLIKLTILDEELFFLSCCYKTVDSKVTRRRVKNLCFCEGG